MNQPGSESVSAAPLYPLTLPGIKKEDLSKPLRKDVSGLILKNLTLLCALLAALVLLILAGFIIARGVPYLNWDMFSWKSTTENLSMLPAILNTLLICAGSLLISVPCGVGAAIYLQEYARPGSKFTALASLMAETLSGIPSIVFGLFGMLFFAGTLHLQLSVLSGMLTMAMMVLPLVVRTSQEALAQIPDSMRQASYALGVGRVHTIFKILLPQAAAGIFSGILLSAGRIIGESAALIYTAGTIAKVALNLSDPGATLSVHLFKLLNEGLFIDQAGAVALVLLVVVCLLNLAQILLCRKMTKGLK